MEKEKISLGQLSPEENERLIDELESEMGKSGAVFEVDSKDAPSSWYKRLLQRIKTRMGLMVAILTLICGLASPMPVQGGTWDTWQSEFDSFDPHQWQGETMVNATVQLGAVSAPGYYIGAKIDGELRGFTKTSQVIERNGVITYLYTVRVKGDASDMGKTVELWMVNPDSGDIYTTADGSMTVSQSVTYTGETVGLPSAPVVLGLPEYIPVEYMWPNIPFQVVYQDIADEGWDLNDKFVFYPENATNQQVTMQMQIGYEGAGEVRLVDDHWRYYPSDTFRQGHVSIVVTSVDNPQVQCYLSFTMIIRLEDLLINPDNLSMDVPKEEWLDMGDYTGIAPDYFTPQAVAIDYKNHPVTIDGTDWDYNTYPWIKGEYFDIEETAEGSHKIIFHRTGTFTFYVYSIYDTTFCKPITFNVIVPLESIGTTPWVGDINTYPEGINISGYFWLDPWDCTETVTVYVDPQHGYVERDEYGDWWYHPSAEAPQNVEIVISTVESPEKTAILTIHFLVYIEHVTCKLGDGAIVQVPGNVGMKWNLLDYFIVEPANADLGGLICQLENYKLISGEPTQPDIMGCEVTGDFYENWTLYDKGRYGTVRVTVEGGEDEAYMYFQVCPVIDTIEIKTASGADADGQYPYVMDGGAQTLGIEYSSSVETVMPTYFDPEHANMQIVADHPWPENWQTHTYDAATEAFVPLVPDTFRVTGTYEVEGTDGTMLQQSAILASYPRLPANAAGGWEWISAGATSGGALMSDVIGTDLVEARTQRNYLINDPEFGYYGGFDESDDFTLDGARDHGHFRIKTLQRNDILLTGTYTADDACWNLNKNWTWVNNPSYYEINISSLPHSDAYSEGDKIKSHTGGWEYVSGHWVGTDALVGHNEALMYYTSEPKTIKFNLADFPQTTGHQNRAAAPVRDNMPIDVHRFMSNMMLVVTFDNKVDEGMSLQAYVGDECRGLGQQVGDRWFIIAYGEGNESLTLCMTHTATGKTYPIDGAFTFCEALGTYASPIVIKAPEIDSLIDISIDETDIKRYDLNGREVSADSQLIPGIYIEKRGANVRKIIVK